MKGLWKSHISSLINELIHLAFFLLSVIEFYSLKLSVCILNFCTKKAQFSYPLLPIYLSYTTMQLIKWSLFYWLCSFELKWHNFSTYISSSLKEKKSPIIVIKHSEYLYIYTHTCTHTHIYLYSFVLSFETGSHYIAQGGLELMIFLLMPPEC
jgi:hypothetical protein